MTYTVQELAQSYAAALVDYHTTKILKAQGKDSGQHRAAANQLFLLHERLDSAAIRAAELELNLV